METHGFKIIDDLAVMGSDFFEDTPPVPSHLCNKKEKNFPCEHLSRCKLCYNSFDNLQFVCDNPCSCGDVLAHIIQVNPRLYKLEVITYCLY